MNEAGPYLNSVTDSAFDVSFCILNYNQRDMLRECIGSCLKEAASTPLTFEIIVIDNASADRSCEMVRELFPNVRLLARTGNGGFGKANNEGIQLARGRYLFILNEDTSLLPGCLPSLVSYMDEHRRVGIAGPRILNPDRTVQLGYHRRLPRFLDTASELLGLRSLLPGNPIEVRAYYSKELTTYQDPFPVEQIAGCAMFVRREILERMNGFDERFPFWFEDVDLCHRIADAGWGITCVPGAQLLHYGGASVNKHPAAELIAWKMESLLCYFRLHGSSRRFDAVRAIALLALALRLPVAFILSFSPRPATRQRWRGAPRAYLGAMVRLLAAPRSQAGN